MSQNVSPTPEPKSEKWNSGQRYVAATGFLSLFSLVGIMFYGLPFFYDFWVSEYGWTRAEVTSGNAVGKILIGPLFGFIAGWMIDKVGPRKVMLSGIVMGGFALIGLELYDDALAILFVLHLQCAGLCVWRAATESGVGVALV